MVVGRGDWKALVYRDREMGAPAMEENIGSGRGAQSPRERGVEAHKAPGIVGEGE